MTDPHLGRLFIEAHRGMVGSPPLDRVVRARLGAPLAGARQESDLRDQGAVRTFRVAEERPLPGADALHECALYCGNYSELTRPEIETLKSCLLPC